MALFRTYSLVLCCSNLEAAKQWWIETFNCKLSQLPAEWDDTLPSDVALKLPGDDEPTVLLCARAEVEEAGLARPNEHPIIFSDKLKKSHEFLLSRGSAPGPIQESRGTQFFEIRDPEGNVIEVCKEP